MIELWNTWIPTGSGDSELAERAFLVDEVTLRITGADGVTVLVERPASADELAMAAPQEPAIDPLAELADLQARIAALQAQLAG
jgi:hypothetical protein